MKKAQWDMLKKCAAMEAAEKPPVGLIVDSPWMPGYTGISTLDYFTIPDKWLEANFKIKKDFPEVIFIPDFWVEFGMAAEPSGFGCRVNFYEHNTPTVNHMIPSADDLDVAASMKAPNPKTDGLMPLILNLYKNIEPAVKAAGESVKIVAARGPLAVAAHLMGVTEFLVGLKIDPDNTHRLLRITSTLAKNWLAAQAEALSEVEGILVLDDVVGFLSREDCIEFVEPYMKEIFGAFPSCLKLFHNDTDNPVCYEFIEGWGVNIFNFTHKQEITKVRELVGSKVCLLGNIPPLDVLTQGTPEGVKEATLKCIESYGRKPGLIVSAGGGVSPGTPGANIRALIDAAV
jgi:uroporphyrinogen-III decarboxylase